MRKQIITCSLSAFLSLIAVTAVQAQSGAYFTAVTNLNPVIYLPLNETVLPPATKPAAINLGSLGSVDNGTYTDGAFPGVPGALVGDADTAGLFSGASGVNPHMSAPYDASYASVTNFTVELWINSPTNDPVEKCIVGCLDVTSPRNGWLIYTDEGGTGVGNFNFRTYYGNGATTAINYVIPVAGGHILANTWYHLVVTYNGATATAQGFIDGQAMQSTNSTNSPTYTTSTAGPFCIGARSDASFAFPGYVDEVAFYPTVLGTNDIASHYAAGTNGPSGAYHSLVIADNPLLYFRLDDGAAPVAKNYGSAGALANGYYESGTLPGAQPGPAFPGMGGPNSVACQFNTPQSSDIGPSVPVVGATGLSVGTSTNNPITLTAWVQASVPSYFTTVLGKGDQSYRFDINQGNGDPHFNVGNNAEIIGTDAADGNWHFWAGTWDGTNLVNLYIDGALEATSSGNATANGNSAQPLVIGTAPDDTGRNLNGNVCQVAIFPTALSQAQVQQLFFSVGNLPPVIIESPQNSVVIVNSNVTFTVSAEGLAPLSYEWYVNSVLVSGATSSSLTLSNVQASESGSSIYVNVTDPNKLQTTSQSANLYVITTPLSGNYFSSVVGLNPLAYYPLNETVPPPPFDDYATNIGTLGAAGNAYYVGMTSGDYQQPPALADANPLDTNFSILVTGGQQVIRPYSVALSNMPPFTVEAWLSSSSPGSEQSPLSLADAGGTRSGWLIYMDASATGVYQFRTFNENGANTSIALSAATAVSPGTWHHLAVVVTTVSNAVPGTNGIYPAGSITASLYLDGVLSASGTGGGSGGYAMDDGGDGGGFSIGARSDNAFNFAGFIEDVAYYTNALTSNTIAAHYAAGLSTDPVPPYYQLVQQSNPLLFYQLDEAAPSYSGVNPTATNYGVNGPADNGFYLPGTGPGAVAGPNVAGFPGTGSNNVAVAFNHLFGGAAPAASGYVDVPTGGSDLNITGPITMAAWIQATPNDGRFETFAGHSDAGYRMDVDTGMDLHFADANSAGDLTGSALNDGNWHFVVGTYDGAHEFLYIDGIQNATQPATGPATGSTDDFTIGVDPQYVTSRMFDGNVSELALFDYALSGPQVLSLFYASDVAPIITQQPPASQVIGNGSSGSITVAAYGTPSLIYQWLNGGTPVSGPEFSGANTATLTISGASPADAGSYSVKISNNYGAVTSSVDVVSISQVPVIIPQLPATTHVLVGTTLTLSVGEIGSTPFTNTWYINGVLITNGGLISGATTTTLTISNVVQGNGGAYTFTVSNSFGTASSSGNVVVDSSLTFDDNALGWTATDNNVDAGQGAVANNVITMTDGKGGEITSFFYDTPMWIHAFKASFTYTDVGGAGGVNTTADGLTFCIQNTAAGVAVLQTGGGGSGLGYYQMSNSIALCMELYNNDGDDAPGIDVATNGQGSAGATGSITTGFAYGPTLPVLITSGDPIDYSIYYDGSNYSVTMTDVTTAATYSTNYGVGAIWETNIIGDDTAYIGFTAATGGVSSTQTIANFYFTPIIPLGVASSNGTVVLSWPTGVGGYVLQQSSNLKSWTTIPGPYTIVGSLYQYVVSPPTGTEFYRLVVSP